jgi:hypothetical protein
VEGAINFPLLFFFGYESSRLEKGNRGREPVPYIYITKRSSRPVEEG